MFGQEHLELILMVCWNDSLKSDPEDGLQNMKWRCQNFLSIMLKKRVDSLGDRGKLSEFIVCGLRSHNLTVFPGGHREHSFL